MRFEEKIIDAETKLCSLIEQRKVLQQEKSLLNSDSAFFQAKKQEIVIIQKTIISKFKTRMLLKQKIQTERTSTLKQTVEENKKKIKELLLDLKSCISYLDYYKNQNSKTNSTLESIETIHEQIPALCEKISILHSKINEADSPFFDFDVPAANFSGADERTILEFLNPIYCPESSTISRNEF